MGPRFREDDGGVFVGALRKFLGSNFKQPSARVPAPPRELVCWFSPLDFEGRRNAERRTLGQRPRLISRIAEKQRHTATPLSVPPRRLLRPWDLTSERRREQARHPGRFPHPSPVSSSHLRQRPVVGPDGYPRPPDAMLARHSRRRRIRPAWVTPPRSSFRSVPLQ